MGTYFLRAADHISVTEILERLARGDQLLCAVCRSPILVAETPEQAKEQGIPPGMQCSRNARHFQAEFYLATGGIHRGPRMRCLLTVKETCRLSVGTQADLVQVAQGGLLLLPYVHLIPAAPNEREVKCGPVQVELRRRGSAVMSVMSASARIVETELPFHVRCRVVVLTDHLAEVAEGTEVWSKDS